MSSIYEEIIKRLDTLATDIAALTINEGAGAAGGALSGSGTTNRITQWTGSSSLGDSTLIKTGAGVLTLDAGADYTLTVPATGTVPLGTGAAGQVTYWSGTNTQTGSNSLFWDIANSRLGIGTATPSRSLSVKLDGTGAVVPLSIYNADTTNGNGITLLFSTDTIGTGASQESSTANIRVVFDQHDHATRAASMKFYTSSSGANVERLSITGTELVVNEGSGNYSFRVESDINTSSLAVDGATGHIGMGIAPNVIAHVFQTRTLAPTASGTYYGSLVDEYINAAAGAAGSTYYGAYYGATLQGTTAMALAVGGRFNLFISGANTTTDATAGRFVLQPTATSGTVTTTSASVGYFQIAKTGASAWAYTNLKFIDVPTFTVGAGSVSGTNAYGVFIGSLANTGATTKYAIYTTNGNVILNDGGDPDSDFRVAADTEPSMIFNDASADALYLGGTTNGVKIDKGGELTLIGTATRWDDLRVEPVVRGTGAKNPSFAVWLNGVYLYDFDDATAGSEKEVWFSVQMPHSWKEGSTVEPHVHWTNKTAGTAGQVIRWGIEYTKAPIGGTFGATTTIYGTTIVGGGDITVANEHLLTDFAGVDMTGDTLSTVIACRLFRNSSNAADTYTGTAGLLYIDWHYEIDSMGSKTELAK